MTLKAYLMPLGPAFCEHRGSVCDNRATHTVALERVGSIGGRYCEDHAQRIVADVNLALAGDQRLPSEGRSE